ncbi:hypothetical protein AAFX88_003421 [Bacillus cereus]
MTRLKKTRQPIRKRLNKKLVLKSLIVSDLQRHFSNTNLFNHTIGTYENFPAATVVFDLSGSSLDIRNRGAKNFAADSQYLFSGLTDIIYHNHGIIEKFPGDGISMHFPSILFDELFKYISEGSFDNINFDGINFDEIDLDEDGFYKLDVDGEFHDNAFPVEKFPIKECLDYEYLVEKYLDEDYLVEKYLGEEGPGEEAPGEEAPNEEAPDEEAPDEEGLGIGCFSKVFAIYNACKAIQQMDYFLRKNMKLCRDKYRFTLTYGKDTIVTTFGSTRHQELITIGHAVNVAHKLEKFVKQEECFLGIDPYCKAYVEYMNIFPHLSSYLLPRELSRGNKPNECWYGVNY